MTTTSETLEAQDAPEGRRVLASEEPEDCFDWVVQKSDTSHSSNFKLLPNGFPILLDWETGLICEPVLLWLYESYYKKNRRNWRNTVWSYARDARDWFVYLERAKKTWADATDADLDKYTGVMELVDSPTTEERYKTRTINRRRIGIIQFYRWIRRERYFQFAELSPNNLLHPDCFPANKIPNLPEEKNHVSVMLPHQIRELFKQLGERPSAISNQFLRRKNSVAKEGGGRGIQVTSRDRLHSEIAYWTGMRIFEVTGLKLSHFERFRGIEINDTQLYVVGPIWRKGGRFANVDFPGILIKEILIYIDAERAYICKVFGARSNFLFLNPGFAGRYRGEPTSTRTIERRFHDACIRARLCRNMIKPSSTPKVEYDERLLFVYHDLRHTYAVMTYFSRRKKNESTWLYLQKQLDHKSEKTTINIYLDALSWYEQIVSDEYMKDLNRAAKS